MEGYEGVVRLYCFYQSGNGGLNILGRNIGSVDDYQSGLSEPSGEVLLQKLKGPLAVDGIVK